MDADSIFKVWGERRRLLLTDQTEIDLLYLRKGGFSSRHNHESKINKFIVVEGKIRIDTEFGKKTLVKNESFEVSPPLMHRFLALEDSIVVECAYVEEGYIKPSDINRKKQGGRTINGKEYTEDQLRKKGMLE